MRESGAVSRMIQVSEKQQEDARDHRQDQARAVAPAPAAAAGSLPARIEMKMMLSMPSTISSTVRVAKPIQAWGSLIQSIERKVEGT